MLRIIDGKCIRCGRQLQDGEKAHYIAPAVVEGKPKTNDGMCWSRASRLAAKRVFSWVFIKLDSGRLGKGLMCMDCWAKRCR